MIVVLNLHSQDVVLRFIDSFAWHDSKVWQTKSLAIVPSFLCCRHFGPLVTRKIEYTALLSTEYINLLTNVKVWMLWRFVAIQVVPSWHFPQFWLRVVSRCAFHYIDPDLINVLAQWNDPMGTCCIIWWSGERYVLYQNEKSDMLCALVFLIGNSRPLKRHIKEMWAIKFIR